MPIGDCALLLPNRRERWRWRSSGCPETVSRQITELLAATVADELMITTMVYDPADRLRSFELLADLARASRTTDVLIP